MRPFIPYTYLLLLLIPVIGFSQSGYDFYISNSGSDKNTGTSVSQPRKTLSGSATLFQSNASRNGHVSIALASGSTFQETLSPAYSVRIGTFNNNSADLGFAILNGSDEFNAGWSKYGSSKNIYKQQIKISGFTGNGINMIGLYSYVYVIEVDKELEKTAPITARRVLQFVSNEDSVGLVPGSFYESPSGPNDPVTLLIHTSNGISPNANPKYSYEVTVRGKAIDATLNTGNFENLWIRGFGAGYGGVPAGANSYFNKVIFGPGAAIHHEVIKSGTVNNSLFLPTSRNIDGGLVFYDVEGEGRHNKILNTIFLDVPYPIYSHHSNGSNYGALELNNVLAFENTPGVAYLMGLSNTDSALLNNIYTDGYPIVYKDGTAEYVQIQNSCFRNARTALMFADNSFKGYINNCLFTVNGYNYAIGIRLGINGNIQLNNSIIHLRKVADPDTSMRSGTFISESSKPTNHITAVGNIFICNVDPSKYVDMASTNTDNGIGTSTDRWSNNVYILLSGKEFHWLSGNLIMTKFSDWQKQSGQDKNSLFFDLRNDPRGLKAIFIDPDNGDYELANTPEGNKIRALNAGMTKPNTCFLAKPSYEAAAQMIQTGNVFNASSCTNPCMLNTIRGGAYLYADIVDNNNVAVEWNNSAQLNIDHYEIERALFGTTNYTKIASLPVAPNDSYIYIDKTIPDAGIYTYRLTVVATNGNKCSSYTYTITVNSVPQSNVIQVYPNPSHGKINVSLRNIKDITGISVVNNVGQKVRVLTSVSGINNAQFDLTGQPPGPYWIKIESANGSYVEPFILF